MNISTIYIYNKTSI